MTLGGTITSVAGLTSVSSTGFTGALNGNASTATTLANARKINGTEFNGSEDITVVADAGTLSGTTLKSTVTSSSLTGVGTITSGIWNGSTIAIANGGTGATSIAAARTNLGLAIGSDVLAYRTFGTAANSNTADFEVPLSFTSPLSRTTNTISIPAATSSVNGYLNSTDWTTFNSKQAALTAGAGITISTNIISVGQSVTTTSTPTFAGINYSGSTSGAANIVAPAIAGTTTITLPAATGTLATIAGTETFTNKTLTSPVLTSPTLVTPILGAATATSINKVSISTPNTSATLSLADGGTLATSGAYVTTITSTGTTNITLPTSGTLATLTGTESLSNKTLVTPIIGSATGTSLSLTGSLSAGTSSVTSLTVSGNETIGGTLGVTGATTLSSASMTGNATVGGTLAVTGATTLSSTSAHGGAATFSSTVNVTGATTLSTLTASGNATLTSLTATGAATFSNTVKISTGAGLGKVLTSDASGGATWSYAPGTTLTKTANYTILLSDRYIFYGSSATAAATFTLPAATSNEGKEIIIKNKSAYILTVQSSGSETIFQENSTIETVDQKTLTSIKLGKEASNNWVKLVSDGTQWVVFRALF